VKARLIRIGNSRGIRLPKTVIEQAGLTDEVVLQVRERSVVVYSARRPRAGWAEAAKRLGAEGGGKLLDPATRTRFDEEEWRW
jgi:antitoxin MazE